MWPDLGKNAAVAAVVAAGIEVAVVAAEGEETVVAVVVAVAAVAVVVIEEADIKDLAGETIQEEERAN